MNFMKILKDDEGFSSKNLLALYFKESFNLDKVNGVSIRELNTLREKKVDLKKFGRKFNPTLFKTSS